MPADLLQLNQYACRSFTTQSVCLLIFYHSFLHACWCCVSLFAMPACMVSHYKPCLMLWSLTIGHAFWCDASLSAMPSGVLSHHRPRLLVWPLIINLWCLTVGHVCWSVATATDIFTSGVQIEGWLQIRCYLYRGVITSDMFAELGPKLQCFLKVKDDLSEVLIFQNVTLNV